MSEEEKVDRTRRGLLGAFAATAIAGPGVAAQLATQIPNLNTVLASKGISLATNLPQIMAGGENVMAYGRFAQLWSEAKSAAAHAAQHSYDLEQATEGLSCILTNADDVIPASLKKMTVAEFFSPAAKLGYFDAMSDGPLGPDWESSELFTHPLSDWPQATRFIQEAGIPLDSTMSIGDLHERLQKEAVERISPYLRQVYQQDPQAFTSKLLSGFPEWGVDTKKSMPMLENLFDSIELLGDKLKSSFHDWAKRAQAEIERSDPSAHYEQLIKLPDFTTGDGSFARYCIVMPPTYGVSGTARILKSRFPALNDEALAWDDESDPMIAIPKGHPAEKIMDTLTTHVPTPKPPRVQITAIRHDGKSMGAALQCAATVAELNR